MGVTFTANIGLAKPDDTELAANWARFTQLADDNNVALAAAANIPLTSYIPTIIGSTSNPNFGSVAQPTAEYSDIRGFIFGSFSIIAGTTGVAAGSGNYGISLPFPADPAFHTVGTLLTDTIGTPSCIGEGYAYDDSTVAGSTTVAIDVVTIAGVSYARMIPESIGGKTSALVGSASPFVLAANDSLSGTFNYKRV